MKCTVFIDEEHEEEVIIYSHHRSQLIDAIEALVISETEQLVGYNYRGAENLTLPEIICFTVEDNKIYAVTEKGRFWIKSRLYQLEMGLPEHFVRINRSSIANIRYIKRFEASFSGTLCITFKNGYKDYVSRRNVKKIKEIFNI